MHSKYYQNPCNAPNLCNYLAPNTSHNIHQITLENIIINDTFCRTPSSENYPNLTTLHPKLYIVTLDTTKFTLATLYNINHDMAINLLPDQISTYVNNLSVHPTLPSDILLQVNPRTSLIPQTKYMQPDVTNNLTINLDCEYYDSNDYNAYSDLLPRHDISTL